MKRGDTHPIAEDFIFGYAAFFKLENKLELLDLYEDTIEELVEEIFDKLECWYFSEDKLLASIKNSIQ